MPYTPPSQRSPAASRPETPIVSQSPSHVKSLEPQVTSSPFSAAPRPKLPRSSSSTSYLHKHRRSPSAIIQSHGAPTTPEATPINSHFKEPRLKINPSASLRQSPPPINDLVIPTGALMSPPDSGVNSSDDEGNGRMGRKTRLENLAELQAAISAIEQHREASPERAESEVRKAKVALDLIMPTSESKGSEIMSPPLSKEARKISHSRSHTESDLPAVIPSAVDTPERSSDSDQDEEDVVGRPPMLRKKSGELVRPALRPASARRRPSSMPGTPTYSKAVHFDSHLEHVKHFLQVDRPLAVSAGSSPVEHYDSDAEFPFVRDVKVSQEPPWEWEIRLPNFPFDNSQRTQLPIRVERVFLSADKKVLIGRVAVQNLAFHKSVVARFTLDFWKTTSEVSAEYSSDVRQQQCNDGCDRFNFSMKLEDQTNLENKTLFFCVRYNVNGQEFWDSNGNINYQVDFSKKHLPEKGISEKQTSAAHSLASMPRGRYTPDSSGKPRPLSASCFDDFSKVFSQFSSPAISIVGETPLRFRNKKAGGNNTDAPGIPDLRKQAPAQAFGNRYDFGASLSAAIQIASNALGDKSGLQTKKPLPETSKPTTNQRVQSSETAAKTANDIQSLKHTTPASEKPALESKSYNELIDKYCFVRSKNTKIDREIIEC